MNNKQALQLYLACRAHFTSDYDIVQYRARIRTPEIDTSKPRIILIDKLAKRFKGSPDLMGFLIPQWIYSDGKSFFDNELAEENYIRWQKFRKGSTYHVLSDIIGKPKKLFSSDKSVLESILRGDIKIETAIALQRVSNLLQSDDVFPYEKLKTKIVKSTPFIKVDEKVIKTEFEHVAS